VSLILIIASQRSLRSRRSLTPTSCARKRDAGAARPFLLTGPAKAPRSSGSMLMRGRLP